MANFLKKLFGSKADRDVKQITPILNQVLAAYDRLDKLSDDDLRAESAALRDKVRAYTAPEEEKVAAIREQLSDPEMEVSRKERLATDLDELTKTIDKKIEEILTQVLPEAFAIVKSTARRFKENEKIRVKATDFDRDLSASHDFVNVDGDYAVWRNSWMAGGNMITWDMVHYDVQLIGGIVLHQGKIAEMATGEGKTLVATLPVFLNALAGKGVHVVTVNDYLSKRDSEWMGPLYMFHGLSVDCIDKHQPNSPQRRKAYQADITFGTNNEFGFDYLRDNMAISPADLVQRAHNYAIVDEVDSVLIDDARTPLIISGPVPKGEVQMFEEYQPLVEKLVGVQRQLATQFLAEAKQKIGEGQRLMENGDKKQGQELLDAGFLSLYRSHKALPKNKPLIKYLSEEGIKAGMLKTEEIYMENNNRRMPECVAPLFFVVDEKLNSCDLTDKGTGWLANEVNDAQLFVLPDITSQLSALEVEPGLSDEERVNKKDELMSHYAVQSERVHTLQQLLKAYCMFNKDDEYVVIDGEVKIVDEQTGRIMEGRRWSDGLHQAVEAKEHVKVEAATQTFATITLQNYFRMYHKLAGMTGTASTEAGEFWDIYKLDVVEIPTNRPVIRNDMDDRVYKTQREKYRAVIEEVVKMRKSGRPTLIGTTSVEISQLLSRMLDLYVDPETGKREGIPHQVLNAKLHHKEADIVALAGQSTNGLGAVTIATNMAGRGTDIKLSPEVKAAGGLAIIGTERHESRRVDRQLRGRAGRQGDPGSSVFYVSLEDKLMRLFASERIASVMDKLGFKEGEMIESPMISKSIERAQKKVEENHFGVRKRLLEYDDVMNKQRTAIYEKRRHALMGERIGMDIANTIWDRVSTTIERNDYQGCKEEFIRLFAMEVPFTEEQFLSGNRNELAENAFQAALAAFNRKTDRICEVAMPIIKQVFENQGAMYERIMVPITDGRRMYNIACNLQEAYETECKSVVKEFEKQILLHIIDDAWKENLRELDELRHSVQNASYEQKDPLLIFKLESAKVWDTMINDMYNRIVSILSRAAIPELQQQEVREAAPEQHTDRRQYTENRQEERQPEEQMVDQNQRAAAQHDTRAQQPRTPIVRDKLPGRNDPCPCGSGKKFKQCHGKGLV